MPNICYVPNCNYKVRAKGLCSTHYNLKRYGLRRDIRVNAERARRRREDYIGKTLRNISSKARRGGIPFNLTEEDIEMVKYCPVNGLELDYYNYKGPRTATLDRILPGLGYVKGNVKIISRRANMLKNNGSIKEFQEILNYMTDNVPGGYEL